MGLTSSIHDWQKTVGITLPLSNMSLSISSQRTQSTIPLILMQYSGNTYLTVTILQSANKTKMRYSDIVSDVSHAISNLFFHIYFHTILSDFYNFLGSFCTPTLVVKYVFTLSVTRVIGIVDWDHFHIGVNRAVDAQYLPGARYP